MIGWFSSEKLLPLSLSRGNTTWNEAYAYKYLYSHKDPAGNKRLESGKSRVHCFQIISRDLLKGTKTPLGTGYKYRGVMGKEWEHENYHVVDIDQ